MGTAVTTDDGEAQAVNTALQSDSLDLGSVPVTHNHMVSVTSLTLSAHVSLSVTYIDHRHRLQTLKVCLSWLCLKNTDIIIMVTVNMSNTYLMFF